MSREDSARQDASIQERNAELFCRLQADDVEALGELIDAYTARLVYMAEITVGSVDMAREAVQDAFVELWEKRHILKSDTKIFSYLLVASRHRAVQFLRHEKMHGRTEAELIRMYAGNNVHSYNDGEFDTEEEEGRLVLQKALADVPARARQIFLLHHESGLSYEEIGNLLGISYATVRVQMAKAANRIGKAFKEWMSGN